MTDTPLAHSVEDARKRIHLGRRKFYEELNRGAIKSFHVGRRRLIPESALVEYVQNMMSGAGA